MIKILNNLKMRRKFAFFVQLPVLITIVLISTVSVLISRDVAQKQSEQIMEATAQEYAHLVKLELESAMQTAGDMAEVMSTYEGMPPDFRRQYFMHLMGNMAANNPDLSGLWTYWGADALDGMDADYASTEGHDETGQFMTMWINQREGTVVVPRHFLEGGDDLLPLETGLETIIEPYELEMMDGNILMMTSLVAPVFSEEGSVVGLVGVDLSFDKLQEEFGNIQIYETGFGRLISANGLVVTHPNLERINKVIGEFQSGRQDVIFERAMKGEVYTSIEYSAALDEDTFKSFAPVFIGEASTPWIFSTVVKQSEVYADVNTLIVRILILGAAGLILVGLFIQITTNSLIKPIAGINSIILRASKGDLSRDYSREEAIKLIKRKDELGEISRSMLSMINTYLQGLANSANLIAQGDLSIEVVPQSEKDELGIAFAAMTASLRELIGAVAENSKTLNVSADQLAEISDQAGAATSQISITMQQIAQGTQDQANAVNQTAYSIDQMSSAISGVAAGAQEQSKAVNQATEFTGKFTSAIQQVAENAAALNQGATNAEQAARDGAETVERTLSGMQSIKTKVGVSGEKVQEMGERSEQIGAIVQTIQDIASQTNLLALNAAIEAARAGEHGKGFAVVADEVRKLAERTSQATREISDLIGTIQVTVSEAVQAMAEGSAEVEQGVINASQSGEALGDILAASEATNRQAEQAAQASQSMKDTADELISVIDTVAAVVEENTAATEEMAANSDEVSQSIENIASVSEENSASVEEVSASAEEMTAQVEEVSASAQYLSTMASSLSEVISNFKFAADGETAEDDVEEEA